MASSHVCCEDIRKAYVIYAVNTQNCWDEEELAYYFSPPRMQFQHEVCEHRIVLTHRERM